MCESTSALTCAARCSLGEMCEVVNDTSVINLCAQNVLNSYWHLSLIVQSFEVYLELKLKVPLIMPSNNLKLCTKTFLKVGQKATSYIKEVNITMNTKHKKPLIQSIIPQAPVH